MTNSKRYRLKGGGIIKAEPDNSTARRSGGVTRAVIHLGDDDVYISALIFDALFEEVAE